MASHEICHVLYYNKFSICSTMVRYAFACRGEPQDQSKKVKLDEKDVNIAAGEQLTEQFLCDINANGEVPVLVPSNRDPLPDSVAITLYLAGFYPSLNPQEHSTEIERCLRQLHDINFFALTFAGKPQRQMEVKQILNDRLKTNISPRYRKAIEYKIQRSHEKKLSVLTDEQEKIHVERARSMMRKVEGLLNESDTGWFFGLKAPSALDAHLIAFIARMLDINRDELVPELVKQYAAEAMSGEAWKRTMQGRKTLP